MQPSNSYKVEHDNSAPTYRVNTPNGFIDYNSEGKEVNRFEAIHTSPGRSVYKSGNLYPPKEEYYTTNDQGEALGISIAPEKAEDAVKQQNILSANRQSKNPAINVFESSWNNPKYTAIPTQPDNRNIFRKGLSNVENARITLGAESKNVESLYAFKKAPPSALGKLFVSGAESFGLGVISGVTTPFVYPKETFGSIVNQVKHPIVSFREMKSSFAENPEFFVGQFYGSSKLVKAGEYGGGLLRDVSIKVATPKLNVEDYIHGPSLEKVSKGESAFPTSSSVGEALGKFEKGRTESGTVKVLSASPNPISSFGQSRIFKVSEGSDLAAKRTVGLYAAPMGEGSPYFFGIGKSSGYKLSILPKFNRPTLSSIEVGSIERIPISVLKGGVVAENKFLKSSPKGSAFISGNLERAFNPSLKGWSTTETEVVVPVGSVGRSSNGLLGIRGHFDVMGKTVPLREYEIINGKSFDFGKPFRSEGKLSFSNGEYSYSYKESVSLSRGLFGLSSYKGTSSSSLGSFSGGSISVAPSFSNIFGSKSSFSLRPNSYKASSSKLFSSNNYYSQSSSFGSSLLSNNTFKTSKSIFNNNYYQPGKLKKVIGKPSKFRFRSRYEPNVEASLFNIYGKMPSKSLVSSGLGFRPKVRHG